MVIKGLSRLGSAKLTFLTIWCIAIRRSGGSVSMKRNWYQIYLKKVRRQLREKMTVEKKNYNPFYLDAHHHREQFFQTLSLALHQLGNGVDMHGKQHCSALVLRKMRTNTPWLTLLWARFALVRFSSARPRSQLTNSLWKSNPREYWVKEREIERELLSKIRKRNESKVKVQIF